MLKKATQCMLLKPLLFIEIVTLKFVAADANSVLSIDADMGHLAVMELFYHHISFLRPPRLLSTVHNASQFTVSKALVRSMKTADRPMFCSTHFSSSCHVVNIISIVLLAALNPRCNSDTEPKRFSTMRRWMTFTITFPETASTEMPL